MGRFYDGNIKGKFWFGIQNSDDASYFGVEYKQFYYYYVCNCTIDEEPNENNTYCNECYSSYEEHIESMIDEDINDDINKTLYISDNEICYDFDKKDLDYVKEKVDELENIYGKYILSYTLLEDNNEILSSISYDCITEDNLEKNILEWVARLCLGKQILYCLNKNGFCCFYAEL